MSRAQALQPDEGDSYGCLRAASGEEPKLRISRASSAEESRTNWLECCLMKCMLFFAQEFLDAAQTKPTAAVAKPSTEQFIGWDVEDWRRAFELAWATVKERADGMRPLDDVVTRVLSEPRAAVVLLPRALASGSGEYGSQDRSNNLDTGGLAQEEVQCQRLDRRRWPCTKEAATQQATAGGQWCDQAG